jgi:hypothetical protein
MPAPLIPPPSKDEVEKFSIEIVKIAKEKHISYLDALVHICEKRNVEAEVAATLLDPLVKEKIQGEAEDLNFMKVKRRRLPIG